MSFKLTLAGDQGGGKSTVAKLLTERTGAEYYSAGYFMRKCAAEMGMDIADFNVYSETHPEIDEHIDNGLVDLNGVDKDMIIDSRMAWHFVKDNFRVYLFCDPMECARRIMGAGRETEHFESVEHTAEKVRQRKTSENKRYFELYGVNIKDPHNYTLLVDTTYATPEEVCERILEGLEAWKADRSYKQGFVCPSHLSYPDDEPDGDKLTAQLARIEQGKEPEGLCVYDLFGACQAVEGAESALAASLCNLPHVPVTLSDRAPDADAKFVKMENQVC